MVTASAQFRQILGIRFFVGDADEAIARMSGGGLLVVPALPRSKILPMTRRIVKRSRAPTW